jgi:hypothetical protein
MGEYADLAVEGFLSGRRGMPVGRPREFPKTSRSAIAGNLFHIVEVKGGNTNRSQGMKLIVCDNTETSYWVWASNKVTGISKDVCKVLEANLSLNVALARLKRKPYDNADI